LLLLIRDELGYQVEVFQVSPIPERSFRGIKIWGIDTSRDQLGMFTGLNTVFAQRGLKYDLKIYYHWHVANPMVCSHSIVVSHGVYWDSPATSVHQFNELARQEWEKRCLYAITAPEAFVVEDRSTANVINAKWAGYHHRLAYIPPGIDLEQFRAVSQDLSDDKIRIICPQDLTLEQGVPEILKLCQIFADRDSRVEFKIIGQLSNFDDALYLAARVRDLPNCRFEWGPLAKLSEFYQESDLALLPSRATEGASLYCLQAMASGLPVVAGPTGGLAEFVVDGWNGRLISPYYLGDLTEALIQLIQNPEQRLRMGANARLLAEGYPLSNWKSKWRNLINRVLQIKTGVITDGSSS
jgi:glycosyltransferase involved in cell wall biosynthesis